jgi:hypothetical protein
MGGLTNPIQEVRVSGFDGQGDDAGAVVAVKLFDSFHQCLNPFFRGF